MKTTVERLPKSAVKISVTISPVEMGKYYSQATEMLSKQVNVAGFRKGKAPKTVLEGQVGKEHLDHQAMDLAISQSYYDVVTKEKLRPIGRPTTDLPDKDHHHLERDGLSYTATVAVMPDIDLGDYQSVKVTPASSAYADQLVDEALAQLRKSRVSTSQVDRAAAKGDRVEIDFVGTNKGKEISGGKSENHPLVIGEDNFIPGFADNLIGMKKGQIKKFTLKFPKDYHEQSLAGQPVEFTVTMKQVQQVSLPEADDAFAGNFGAKSISELKKRLAENLKREKDLEAERQTQEAVVMKVAEQAKTDTPDLLVEDELNRMMAEFREQVERQGLSFEQYLGHLKKTEEDLRAEQRPEAERRVKISLVLNAIQEKENLKPSQKDIDDEVAKQLAQAPNEEAKKQMETEDFRHYVTRVLGNRMVVRKLVDYATR